MPAHDVLIIGAGLAGQRAALAAARAGASVAIMSKVHPVRSHSVAAAGGINAAISVDDDWHSHAYDTVKGSDFLGDQDAIEVMCSEAPGEVMHLEHIGVTFHRNDDGEMDLRAFGGASMKRTAYVADITGQAMLHVLYEQLMRRHDSIDSFEEWFTTSLVRDEHGRCCGVIARDVRDGRMEAFTAKNVILACGGAGQVYKPTTNGLIVTGDGIAMAYRAGAPLMDMEMVQYHPTTLLETGILITEGARGEGAHLLNAAGERFMERSAPNKMELASRDVVSRAEQIEIEEGRGVGPGGAGVLLDVTVVPRRRTLEALREIVNLGRDFAGVDITREPIVIRPGQHYIMGGVKTDVDGRTPIEGLYAAGEVACVSVHGGNRLGANSLLDTLIFGRRAGEHAAARAAAMPMPRANGHARLQRDAEMIDEIIARPREGRRVSEIKSELGETMNRHAAVFRDEQGLSQALETIGRLREEAGRAWIDDRGTVFNQDVLGAIELGYMIDCAEATVVAALERKESRGAQYRTDFPERDDEEWLKHIDVALGDDGRPRVGYSPVTITQWQPEERKY
jgi:succinate dehydrogenase flavoprotein subunit